MLQPLSHFHQTTDIEKGQWTCYTSSYEQYVWRWKIIKKKRKKLTRILH